METCLRERALSQGHPVKGAVPRSDLSEAQFFCSEISVHEED